MKSWTGQTPGGAPEPRASESRGGTGAGRQPIMSHPKKILFICALALLAAGCNTLASINSDTGVVIAKRAQVRSSVAVVAADLVEVTRGDVVDILDSDTAENGDWAWL